MHNKTKIIVLSQKWLFLTLSALVLIIILSILIMLSTKQDSLETSANNFSETSPNYTAGVYSSCVVLNGNPVDIQVTMDKDKIHDITLINNNEAVTTTYPIFSSSFDYIREQVISNNSTRNIYYSTDNQYTGIVITNAIENAINKSVRQ